MHTVYTNVCSTATLLLLISGLISGRWRRARIPSVRDLVGAVRRLGRNSGNSSPPPSADGPQSVDDGRLTTTGQRRGMRYVLADPGGPGSAQGADTFDAGDPELTARIIREAREQGLSPQLRHRIACEDVHVEAEPPPG